MAPETPTKEMRGPMNPIGATVQSRTRYPALPRGNNVVDCRFVVDFHMNSTVNPAQSGNPPR
jgi:hypothetical protein